MLNSEAIMKERFGFLETEKFRKMKFLRGEIFRGPKEDIFYGKFVRIGKLIVVSADSSDDHSSLITEPRLGAGDVARFLGVSRRLANSESVQLDAGFIELSLVKRAIILSKKSLRLFSDYARIVPVNPRAREVSGEIFRSLSPGFVVTTNLP